MLCILVASTRSAPVRGAQSTTVCANPDTCDGTGSCLDNHAASGTACGETTPTACSQGDGCQASSCMSGASVSCDDDEPCTVDSCDPDAGCAHSPAADGTACPGGLCYDGACVDPTVLPTPPVSRSYPDAEVSCGCHTPGSPADDSWAGLLMLLLAASQRRSRVLPTPRGRCLMDD